MGSYLRTSMNIIKTTTRPVKIICQGNSEEWNVRAHQGNSDEWNVRARQGNCDEWNVHAHWEIGTSGMYVPCLAKY